MRLLVRVAGVLALLGAPRDAAAYLDPATGSAVIQMVVAGVMGALFMLKLYWRKLMTFFGGATPVDDELPSAQSAASDEADRQ